MTPTEKFTEAYRKGEGIGIIATKWWAMSKEEKAAYQALVKERMNR